MSEWQKQFVSKVIKETNISHENAMTILGLVCNEREKAYMEGYNKGYSDGWLKISKRIK
jgi:hypothetical protein